MEKRENTPIRQARRKYEEKNKLIVNYIFFCGGSLSAQQHLPFYYYKGNRIMLPVNTQHFLVYADANKISKELFEKEYRVTEWIEDGSNGILTFPPACISCA